MKNFCRSLCCIFSRSNKKKEKLIDENSESTELKDKEDASTKPNSSDELESHLIYVFDSSLLRKTESYFKNLTKEKVEKLINEELNSDDFSIFYNKNDLKFWERSSGSIFSKNFPMIKMNYTLSKKNFPKGTTKETIAEYINDPKKRMEWDKGMKEYKIVKNFELCHVLSSVMKKPLPWGNDRDMVEKKCCFFKENEYYSLCSSVDDNYYYKGEGVDRMTTYFSGFKITENKDNFDISSCNQIDYKTNIPFTLLKVTMPTKIIEFYNTMAKAITEDFKKIK